MLPAALGRMVPAGPCLQPQSHAALASRRSFFAWPEWAAGAANDFVAVMSNVDGTISLFQRLPPLKPVLGQLEQARGWLQNWKHSPVPELTEEMLKKSVAMIGTASELAGQNPFHQRTQVELQKQVHELFVYIVLLQLLSTSTTSHFRFRIVHGVPTVYCWESALVESFSLELLRVPKPFRPVGQAMGDADAEELRKSGAFSEVASASEDLSKTYDDVKRRQAEWIPKDVASNQCGKEVRRLLTVHGPKTVASSDGVLYFTTKGTTATKDTTSTKDTTTTKGTETRLLKHDFEGKELKSFPVSNIKGCTGMAIAGDTVVASLPDKVLCFKLSEEDVKCTEPSPSPVKGISVDQQSQSHAYYCVGHSVVCLDCVTMKEHSIMGKCDEEGCGKPGTPPTKLLLHDPSATAVVDSRLFIADTGNHRVLCLDMRENHCTVVFEGEHPSLLAADGDGLCVYDGEQNKIFHVSMGTWEKEHVLGTGTRAFSREGLPPRSTNLGKVISMALGHGRELTFVCDDDDNVRTCRMPASLESSATPCATSAGPMSATDKGQEGLIPLQHDCLQPTCGFKLDFFCSGQPTPMILSEPLPHDQKEVHIKCTLSSPMGGVGISLLAENVGDSNRRPVDCHLMSSPEWNARVFVSTLSKLTKRQNAKQESNQQVADEQVAWQRKPFQEVLKKGMKIFHDWVKSESPKENSDKESPKENSIEEAFYLRRENHLEATVERRYDEREDCSIVLFKELKVNGKRRAGELDEIKVGPHVPVRLCIFAFPDGPFLKCKEPPKISELRSYV